MSSRAQGGGGRGRWRRGGRLPARLAVLVLLAATAAPGCVPVDGGAVELAWELRTPDGKANKCQYAAVDQIRLCWQPIGGDAGTPPSLSCISGKHRDFPCTDTHGATQFEVAPGRSLFWVEPVCGDGKPADPSTYDAPAPVARTVSSGKVVDLQALVIVATDNRAACPSTGCTCPQ